MLRLSVNEMTTYRWSFEEDVQNYLAADISAISVWRHKLSDFGEEKGAELLHESKMSVASLLWAGGFTGSDGRTFKDAVEDGREAVRLAAQLNAGCLIVYTGGRAGHTHNHARRLVVSALKDLVEVANAVGVILALEPMHVGCACDWTFLNGVDDTLELIDEVGSPRVKLAFDTYHLCQDACILSRLPLLAPRIAIIQLGDSKVPPKGDQNRCRLGAGVVPLPQIVSTLAAAGYDGYYDIELMGEDIETSDYRDLLIESKRTAMNLFV